MSGEQHVPETLDLDGLEAGHDGLVWEAWQNVHAEFHAAEAGRGPFGVKLAPATGSEDYGRGEIVQAVAVHNALPELIAAARQVRTLPDREAIALIVRAALCGCRRSANVHGEGMGRHPDERYTQELVDAVFALFGWEVQR